MPFCRCVFALLLLAAVAVLPIRGTDAPEPTAPALPTQVAVPAMKTSIYVGSVTLKTTPFARAGTTWSATYEARVFPWAFWSEHGEISIHLAEDDLARLLGGEQIEFTGDARNHKGKPRPVTGRATPASREEGRIKVRITADGVELVFNGTYSLQHESVSRTSATAAPR